MKGIILIVLLVFLILVAMAPGGTKKQGQPIGTTFTIGPSAMQEYSLPADTEVGQGNEGSDSPTYSRAEI